MAGFEAINGDFFRNIGNSISKTAVINAVGWAIVGLVVVGLVFWFFWWNANRKKFNKKIVAESIIHGYFHPVYRDVAKSVRLGKGGFEILYLKKLKTWKLAQGARAGINEYHFYVLPDGYWYSGQVSGDLLQIDKAGGLMTVVSTNPTMRSQYTSLEKQIDDLHKQKTSFWDKYGQWVLSIGFIAIMGIFSWLSFREVGQFLGSGSRIADQMTQLAEVMNRLAVNLCTNNSPSGLIPAT